MSIKISMEVDSNIPNKNLFTEAKSQNSNDSEIVITAKLLQEDDALFFDGNQFVEFLITFSVGVASGVVGNYIYNAIHTIAKKLKIDGRRTRLTEESISQAIQTIKEMLEEKEKEDKSPQK
jgi:hypothetical protein